MHSRKAPDQPRAPPNPGPDGPTAHTRKDWLFVGKLKVKGTERHGLEGIFPPGLNDVLAGYWEKELGRLVNPVPPMGRVLAELRKSPEWLEAVQSC
jgi:hypothetical protein